MNAAENYRRLLVVAPFVVLASMSGCSLRDTIRKTFGDYYVGEGDAPTETERNAQYVRAAAERSSGGHYDPTAATNHDRLNPTPSRR